MATHTGGCLCKGVRYEFSVEPLMTISCYCRDCQQVTGSPFTTVSAIPRTAFHLLHGELGAYTIMSQGSRAVTREFCKVCGSALFTRAEMVPDLIFIKAVSLDDPSWVKPIISCWTSRAQPWAPIAAETQQCPENPQL